MNNPHLIRDIEIDRLKSEKEQFKQRAELLNLHNEKWVQKIRDQEAELVSLRAQLQAAMEERDTLSSRNQQLQRLFDGLSDDKENEALRAELNKSREKCDAQSATIAHLDADLATANSRLEEGEKHWVSDREACERQTQQLLNDIENLRAEISTLRQ